MLLGKNWCKITKRCLGVVGVTRHSDPLYSLRELKKIDEGTLNAYVIKNWVYWLRRNTLRCKVKEAYNSGP